MESKATETPYTAQKADWRQGAFAHPAFLPVYILFS